MSTATPAPPRRLLFGLEIDAVRLPAVVDLASTTIAERGRLLVGVVNAAKIAKLQTDRLLLDSLLASDLLLADGQSVVWASRLLRRPLPERVAGIDLFTSLLGLADDQRLRVYLLGATPEVLVRLQAVIAERWPDARVVGAADGYYAEDEADAVAGRVAGCRPDLLFLGMTTPRKETFVARYGAQLDVPVVHGVGGSFDVVAGVTRRAPLLWQRCGMEWAYRVLQEPRRLWRRYLVTNAVFLGLTAVELVRPRARYPRPPQPVAPRGRDHPRRPTTHARPRPGSGPAPQDLQPHASPTRRDHHHG